MNSLDCRTLWNVGVEKTQRRRLDGTALRWTALEVSGNQEQTLCTDFLGKVRKSFISFSSSILHFFQKAGALQNDEVYRVLSCT